MGRNLITMPSNRQRGLGTKINLQFSDGIRDQLVNSSAMLNTSTNYRCLKQCLTSGGHTLLLLFTLVGKLGPPG